MAETARAGNAASPDSRDRQDISVLVARFFAWSVVAALSVFLINNYLTYWREWPGPLSAFRGGNSALAWIEALLYVAGIALAAGFVTRTRNRLLRPDSAVIYSVTAYIVRAAFWAVFLIGLADMVVSFLRVEGLLPALLGDQLAIDLSRSSFRGFWVHFPMLGLGLLIAMFHRGLGFHWLALLVVAAELLIVLTRFIFSYEQAFMADLVRFWYAALFLFASAYTLLEEGHVRVDVLYSTFSDRSKGMVNAIGSVVLGLSLCTVIIILGMNGRSTVINGPLLIFETTQTGFGMYVKYWMAGFLAIFAISMMLQFAGYFLEGVADFRGEPNKREPDSTLAIEG